MGEIILPDCKLTAEEENLLKPPQSREARRHSWCDAWNSNESTEPQPQSSATSMRTVESLTNEMVSNIMGAVKKLSTEKMMPTHSSSMISDIKEETTRRQDIKRIQTKLFATELLCLRLGSLQFAALKSLNILLTSSMFSELLFVAKNVRSDYQERNEQCGGLQETMKFIVHNLVEVSTKQCKLKNVVNASEFERAHSVLHFSYIKYKDQDHVEVLNVVPSTVSLETGESSNKQLSRRMLRRPPVPVAQSSASSSNSTSNNSIGRCFNRCVGPRHSINCLIVSRKYLFYEYLFYENKHRDCVFN